MLTEDLFQKIKRLRALFPFLDSFECTFPEGEVYLVGGVVRDWLLGRDTKDTDFLVRKVPAPSLHAFLGRYGKVHYVGKNFGVYKFRPTGSDIEIDIALPRTERSFSNKGIYRDFEIHTDAVLPVEEDLKRRDFTINAMAVDIKRLSLLDPFDGLKSLREGSLCAVGDPLVRFSEDYSRLLRGLRFACQFRFHFDRDTWNAILKTIGFLNAKQEDGTFVVPRETIAKEMLYALVSNPVGMFNLWDQSGAFAVLIPELLNMKQCPQPSEFHSEGDVWTHTSLALAQLTTPGFEAEFKTPLDAENALSVLLHDVGKPYTLQTPERDGVDRIRFNNHDHVGARVARDIIKRLKLESLPKESRYAVNGETVAWLIEKHLILVHGQVETMRASTLEKYFLSDPRLGQKLMQLLFCDGAATVPANQTSELRHYHQLKKRLAAMKALSESKTTLPPPFLSGQEIMALLDIPSGPAVGQYLRSLREEQLSGRVTHREEAVLFVCQAAQKG